MREMVGLRLSLWRAVTSEVNGEVELLNTITDLGLDQVDLAKSIIWKQMGWYRGMMKPDPD